MNTETKAGIEYIRLSDLTMQIRKTIADSFNGRTFWVVAEVSGHKYYANNDWHYFTLVEKIEDSEVAVAKIKGKAWNAGSLSIKKFEERTGQRFTDGIQVLVKVEVEYHIIHELSLTVLDIDIAFTLGTLEKQRQATLARLLADNPEFIQLINGEYITRNKRLKLNCVLQRIALIGSEKSKGLSDFQHTISSNAYQYKYIIDYYYTTVQGTDAERQLVNALIAVHNSGKKYDAVVILRGGGAKTDFLVFDTYRFARAVAKFPVPVITGIGHYEDVSIVDLMAHSHKIVPTKAAEFIIAHNRFFEEELMQLQKKTIINVQRSMASSLRLLNSCNNSILHNSKRIIARHKDSLAVCKSITTTLSKTVLYDNRIALNSLFNRISLRTQIIVSGSNDSLFNLKEKTTGCIRTYLNNKSNQLTNISSVMKIMSPVNILKKGFAIIHHNNRIASDGTSIPVHANIRIQMHDATLISTVISKTDHGSNTDL